MLRATPDRPIQLLIRGQISKDSCNFFQPTVTEGVVFHPNLNWGLRVKCVGIEAVNVINNTAQCHRFNILISLVRDWNNQQMKSIGRFTFNNFNNFHYVNNASFLHGINTWYFQEPFYVYIVPETEAIFNPFTVHCLIELFVLHY